MKLKSSLLAVLCVLGGLSASGNEAKASSHEYQAQASSYASAVAERPAGVGRPFRTAEVLAKAVRVAGSEGPPQDVLELALKAVSSAVEQRAVAPPPTLTVIDYSRPSTEPRLWVIDLESGNLLYRELVAHGKNTGGNLATRFSNEPDSLQTSLGLFVTEGTYVGSNGYSLRLNGLEKGVNDRARERAIVMHGAPYVDQKTAASLGRLGRSWGCPALRPAVARQVIDRIKGGSVVFSYYPDRDWLASSRFLGGPSSRAD